MSQRIWNCAVKSQDVHSGCQLMSPLSDLGEEKEALLKILLYDSTK